MAVVAPSESFGSFVQPYIDEAMRRQQEAIEEMCWKMLDPEINPHRFGLLVETTFDLNACSAQTEITLTPDVPFGQIHYKR